MRAAALALYLVGCGADPAGVVVGDARPADVAVGSAGDVAVAPADLSPAPVQPADGPTSDATPPVTCGADADKSPALSADGGARLAPCPLGDAALGGVQCDCWYRGSYVGRWCLTQEECR